MDGCEQEVVRGHHGHELQTGRHCLLRFLKHLVDAGVHLGGIGSRRSKHHKEGTRTVLNVRREVVAHGTDLHLSHVAQVQHAASTGAQHDVFELILRLQRSLILHVVLIGVTRLFA